MTWTLHYTSETYPPDGTWTVYAEQYAHQDAAEPIDGSTRVVETGLPDYATAEDRVAALQAEANR